MPNPILTNERLSISVKELSFVDGSESLRSIDVALDNRIYGRLQETIEVFCVITDVVQTEHLGI